jgi:hypothetical protein
VCCEACVWLGTTPSILSVRRAGRMGYEPCVTNHAWWEFVVVTLPLAFTSGAVSRWLLFAVDCVELLVGDAGPGSVRAMSKQNARPVAIRTPI